MRAGAGCAGHPALPPPRPAAPRPVLAAASPGAVQGRGLRRQVEALGNPRLPIHGPFWWERRQFLKPEQPTCE